jgi:uncharacterized protein (DUF1330 family)
VSAYAIGILNDVIVGDDIAEYLHSIDATLQPFGGRFAVHGAANEVHEGDDPGTVVIIEFPVIVSGRAWYESDAYQAIIHLRANNSRSIVLIVDGVEPGHVATDVLAGAPS